MTRPFALPTEWASEPYPTHHSFAYASNRDDFEFRVEFTASVPESEQLAVIALIENAPRLLRCLIDLLPAAEDDAFQYGCDPDADADILAARAAIASATGKDAA